MSDPEVYDAVFGPPPVTNGDGRVMCAVPDDCPLGPDPHPLTVPDDHRLPCCCRQPGEVDP